MPIELNESKIRIFLKENSLGRLGYTDGTTVYIVPMNYRLESNSIILYSLEGKKTNLMRNHPSVCFEVDRITDSNNWESVVITGFFEEIIEENELTQLRPLYTEYMLRKRASLASDPTLEKQEPATAKQEAKQVFFRIIFDQVTGRSQSGFM
ncbi:MAG: pyridoxamine 5'-phosphate oxidase family protein [Flavobacterium sp.]|nr:pyridoxamine 5'-phosphate oxidase family protein [Pedobacter sp.]